MAIKTILFVIFILATIGTSIWAIASFVEDESNSGKIAGSILAVLFYLFLDVSRGLWDLTSPVRD